MRVTKNILREHQIFNPHNLAKAGGSKLYIDYSPEQRGRMNRSACWVVIGIDIKVAPNAHWADNGNMCFNLWNRTQKQDKLKDAFNWCLEKFSIPLDRWEKDPYGGYQIKGTIKSALDG